jgi:hypothetical protein
MKELWIKKTVFKCLLIDDDDIEIVEMMLRENTKECVDSIDNIFNKNFSEEYDNEETITPIEYSVNNV